MVWPDQWRILEERDATLAPILGCYYLRDGGKRENQEQIVHHANMLHELQPRLKVSCVGSAVLTPSALKDIPLFSVKRLH